MTAVPAILGGEPVRSDPWIVGPMIDEAEKSMLLRALEEHNFSRYVGSAGPDIDAVLEMTSEAASRVDAPWHFLGGPNVRMFAHEFAERFDVPYAIPINAATSGLSVAIGAVGIEPGDEVILPAISFSASAMAPLLFGGIPVFADVDAETFCISPASFEAAITDRTRAVIVVHLAGNICDMGRIMELAQRRGIAVIEDAAQAIGGEWQGKKAGTIGDAGVFSFQQSKNITTGEGGMIVTHSPAIARKCRLIMNHGEALMEDYHSDEDLMNVAGLNCRLPELCAAIGRAQLAKLDTVNAIRTQNADLLCEGLKDLPGLNIPAPQRDTDNAVDVPHMFVAKYDEAAMGFPRSLFVSALGAEGVPVGTGYTRTMYANPNLRRKIVFGSKGFPWKIGDVVNPVSYEDGICPVAERLLEEEFLWFYHIAHPSTEQDMADVINAVKKVVENRTDIAAAQDRLSNMHAENVQGRLDVLRKADEK